MAIHNFYIYDLQLRADIELFLRKGTSEMIHFHRQNISIQAGYIDSHLQPVISN